MTENKSLKEKKLQQVLCCPLCKKNLKQLSQKLTCSDCNIAFPIVSNTPILIAQTKAHDYLLIKDESEHGPISKHEYAPRSLELIEKYSDGLVLDLGSGGKDISLDSVIQLDIFNFNNVDVVALGEFLPFKDNSFDAVICQAVFEHLKYPEIVAKEIERVLKPQGIAKIDSAFLHPLHGYPNHYFNATQFGLEHWFENFNVLWRGVEPYQMPWIMFDTIMSVYLHEMPQEQKNRLKSATLAQLLEATDKLKTGRSENVALCDALLFVQQGTVDMIAAGVSILVEKKANTIASNKLSHFQPSELSNLTRDKALAGDKRAILYENKYLQSLSQLEQAKQCIDELQQQIENKQQLINRLIEQRDISSKKIVWFFYVRSKHIINRLLFKIKQKIFKQR